jgi:hypothetical protein
VGHRLGDRRLAGDGAQTTEGGIGAADLTGRAIGVRATLVAGGTDGGDAAAAVPGAVGVGGTRDALDAARGLAGRPGWLSAGHRQQQE